MAIDNAVRLSAEAIKAEYQSRFANRNEDDDTLACAIILAALFSPVVIALEIAALLGWLVWRFI